MTDKTPEEVLTVALKSAEQAYTGHRARPAGVRRACRARVAGVQRGR